LVNWLRNKLSKFLGIDELSRDVEHKYKRINQRFDGMDNEFRYIKKRTNQVLDTSDHILNQFNISTDLSPYEHHRNWAIICIKGKPEYVKFVDLGHRDARELQMFIKRFEGTNRIIDTPHREFFL
jgi:hypothetical protein